MRDIITPVKFEPSDESSTTTSADSLGLLDEQQPRLHEGQQRRQQQQQQQQRWLASDYDSLELCRVDNDNKDKAQLRQDGEMIETTTARSGCCCLRHKEKRLHASPVERIVSSGAVQVLPTTTKTNSSHSPADWPASSANALNDEATGDAGADYERELRNKLTKTHWQPPTDARLYEIKQLKRMRHKQRTSDKIQGAATQEKEEEAEAEEEVIQKHHSQLQKLHQHQARFGGPPIVRHQVSSSRRLLKQLAKLRQLDETSGLYKHRRRPDSVAKVEQLIEQLERATCEWDEDEHLLDRAERRDWPAQFQQRLDQMDLNSVENIEDGAPPPPRPGGATGEDLLDFGHREDVPSLEEKSIAISHAQNLGGEDSRRETTSSFGRKSPATTKTAPRPSPMADRYGDDLAVRRLSTPTASSKPMQVGGGSSASSPKPMSYLLCTNAYGSPEPIETRSRGDTLERRIRKDDLHYRQFRTMSRNSTPLPFGIPRNQSTQSLARLSANERLFGSRARSQASPTPTMDTRHSERATPFLGSECCHCQCQRHLASWQPNQQPPAPTPLAEVQDHEDGAQQRDTATRVASKRPDSRVSFAPSPDQTDRVAQKRPAGRISADSGLADEVQSPQLKQEPTSTPPTNQAYEADDPEQEVELAELVAAWSPCESPALERVHTELAMGPVRRRPRINIDQPRAKSPLLRGPSPAFRLSHQVGAGRKDTSPDAAPPSNVMIQTYSDSLKRRSNIDGQQRRSICEVECKYDFSDEEGRQVDCPAPRSSRLFVTTYESPPGESSATEEDQEAASLRALNSAIASHEPAGMKANEPIIKGVSPNLGPAKFTIGHYQSLKSRRNLKIL